MVGGGVRAAAADTLGLEFEEQEDAVVEQRVAVVGGVVAALGALLAAISLSSMAWLDGFSEL
jgi:CHASE3 domain sensor protein